MEDPIERRERRKEEYRKFPTVPDDEDDRELTRIAKLFFKVVVAEGEFRLAGRQFLDASDDTNPQDIIEHCVEHLAALMRLPPDADVRRAVNHDFRRIFGWHDLRDLDVGGTA